MRVQGLASKKIGMGTALLTIAVIAIPAYFWFHFLYDQFVVEKMTPEMAKMRDGMMHPQAPRMAARALGTKKPAEASAKKGENRTGEIKKGETEKR